MAGVMLIFYILFTCQIVLIVNSTNNTISTRKLVLDADGRVIEAATRIVGGESVEIKTYPFAVSVQWRLSSRHHCGGTYILPRFILSAAHCMVRFNGIRWQPESPRFFVILAGSTNLWYSPTWQISVTDAVLPHPKFTYRTMANDIGLYRISRPFRITPYVNFAPLPSEPDPNLHQKNQAACTVIGWGRTSEFSPVTSDNLQHVKVPLIEDCSPFFPHTLHPTQICAGKLEGGVDACQGDSGGPLLCNATQIGIVSWGYGCAAPRSPGVYVRIDSYLDWIMATTLKNNAFLNKTPSIAIWICVIYSIITTDL